MGREYLGGEDMSNKNISMAVIRRLPKYHRYLGDLLDRDIQRISSKELSEIIGFTASQIRQDLNNFGGFGQQGYGYNVEELYNEIGNILGLSRKYNTIIVGAGNLGQAIANYSGFSKAGFKIKALFDAREANEDAHKRIEKAIENLKSEIQGTLFNHEKRISKLEGNLVPSF